MKVWNSFPMLRLIPPFLVGVISTSFLSELIEFNSSILVTFSVAFGSLILASIFWTYRLRRSFYFGLILWPSFYILGSLLTVSVSDNVFPEYLNQEQIEGSSGTYLAVIDDEPQQKKGSVKVVARVIDLDCTVNGRVLLYFDIDSLSQSLKYGEQLLIHSKFSKVEGMGNPNEFNYTRYLRFHNIIYRGQVRGNDWRRLSAGDPGITGWFLSIRSDLIEILKESGLEGNELSVASALILGYRTDLDKELMNAYAGAGATHVLAVSGLHVGIVYVILNFLLKSLNRFKHGEVFRTIILVSLLFSYAALTGLSASVFRAATMFSFVAIGSALNRNTNIFNTLAASAFCLILYEPMIIMQVGFQLSYAAVIGIVLIQPRLFNLYSFNNRFADWAWSITCVSVAAQIATFPLGLLYFHQFPNLFLVSNLLVIPAAAGILYLGFSLFVASLWKPALLFFGFLLDGLISSLNKVVIWIEQIPYSVLSGIDISIAESLIIYLIIIGMLLFIIQQKRYGLYSSIILGCAFLTMQIIEFETQRKQRFTTIYNIRGETAIALVEGTSVTFIASEKLWMNEQSMLFHVRHHWWNKGIDRETFIPLNDSIFNKEIDRGGSSFALIHLPNLRPRISNFNFKQLNFVVITKMNSQLYQLPSFNVNGVVYVSNSGWQTHRPTNPHNQLIYFLDERGAVKLSPILD